MIESTTRAFVLTVLLKNCGVSFASRSARNVPSLQGGPVRVHGATFDGVDTLRVASPVWLLPNLTSFGAGGGGGVLKTTSAGAAGMTVTLTPLEEPGPPLEQHDALMKTVPLKLTPRICNGRSLVWLGPMRKNVFGSTNGSRLGRFPSG
jgi:hypothetical protein